MTDDGNVEIPNTNEVLTPAELAALRRYLVEARDRDGAPISGAFEPVPPSPEPAGPGVPPPPHPAWRDGAGELPGAQEDEDPVLAVDLADLSLWGSRLRATPLPPWSVAAAVTVHAPARRHGNALIDEMGLTLTALHLPEASLNPHPEQVPLLSRLRMLHGRLLPDSICVPLTTSASELAGRSAVLDRLAMHGSGGLAGFSLAAELTPDEGLVVLGSAPPERGEALEQVAIPLARMVSLHDGSLRWPLPPNWTVNEWLDVTTDTARATVRLEQLWPGADLDQWRTEVFARAPFLRDSRTLEDRPVTVRGADLARLERFHWQPSGRGRELTTVVTGVAGDAGFSFVIDGPFEPDGTTPVVDALELLATVEILPDDQLSKAAFVDARQALAHGNAREALLLIEEVMHEDLFPPLDILEHAARSIDLRELSAAAGSASQRPRDAATLLELGKRLLEVGLARSALAPLQRTVQIAPGHADGLVWLSVALEQQQRYRDARSVLGRHRELLAGDAVALHRLAHTSLLIGDRAGVRDALHSMPSDTPDDQLAETKRRRLEQAVARIDAAESASRLLPLDDSDLRGWHFVVTGGVLTGLAPPAHEGMNGRFALLYDSYATCHAGLVRLVEVVLAWQEPPARILAFPDGDSRALALAAQQLFGGGTVADYQGEADEALLIAYDLATVDELLLRRLSLTEMNQVLFSHVANWVRPPVVAPDVVTVLAQSMQKPWDARMQVNFEPGQEGPPSVVQVPPDHAKPEVLAERIVGADPDTGVLFADDRLEDLRSFVGAVGRTATGALHHGVRDRFWPYDIVPSAHFT